jgi:hypothetical protein
MTVSTETLSKAVTAASVVAGTPIDFNGNVFSTDDLAVYYNGDQLATYSTDYTVTLASDFTSAQVTPTAALVAKLNGTDDLLIRRDIALLQPTNLPINSKFPETSLERFMDKVIALFQQVEDKFQRSLLTSAGEANRNLELPAAITGRALTWAADGSLENSDANLADLDAALAAATAAQTAAESARDAALSAYDNFDDRYLGVKASAPVVDNDGDPLAAGALYFDSTLGAMQVYSGSSWAAPAAELSPAGAAINALTAAANKIPLFSSASAATLLDFVDEDDMASNSATAVPSQQSVKAYVDNSAPDGATGDVGYVEFNASGTFTKASYPGAKSFEAIVQGPGGDGAFGDYGAGRGGGAGGAGGQAIKIFNPADLAASITVTINSTKAEFGHTTPVVGNAGSNGSSEDGGAGGTATGGDLNYTGESGEDAEDNTNNRSAAGGRGGSPIGLYPLGAGGHPGSNSNVAGSSDMGGENGQGYGSGGGGAACNDTGSGGKGSGAPGYVLVRVNY